MALPFPFDQVEQFFRDIFNQIIRDIARITGSLLQGIGPLLQQVKDFISSSFASFSNTLFNQLSFVRDQITGALVGLPGKVASLLGGVAAAIQPLFSTLLSQLTAIFNTILTRIQGFIIPALSSLQSFISNGLAAAQRTLTQIAASISQAIGPILSQVSNFVNNLPNFLLGQLRNIQSFFTDNLNRVSGFLQQQLNSVIMVASQTNQGVNSLINGFNIISKQTADAFGILGQIGTNFGKAIFEPLQNAIGSLKTLIFDPLVNTITSLPDAIRHIAKPTGSITPEDAAAQLSTMGPLVLGGQFGIIGAGVLGEVLSFGQVDQIARAANDAVGHTGLNIIMSDYVVGEYAIGVRPALIQSILKKYVPLVPGPADLVNMVVKEAFVPEFRTPAPELFAKNMELQGFSRFWSDTFWTAHWRPIEFETAVDMFHRGIIDRADLLRRLVILDFRPDDAAKLQELTFRLPNRVEARIMSRFGLLTDDQILEILKAEGVREDFIEPLRIMMQEFNLTSIFTKTETAAISAFEDGLINEGQLRALAQQVRRPPGVVDMDVKLALLKRDLEYKRFQIKTLSEAMDKGIIPIEEGKSELNKLQLDQTAINLIIARSEFRLKFLVSKDVKKAAPQLTPSQILAAVKKGTIDAAAALNTLVARGYTSLDAEILLRTALA